MHFYILCISPSRYRAVIHTGPTVLEQRDYFTSQPEAYAWAWVALADHQDRAEVDALEKQGAVW